MKTINLISISMFLIFSLAILFTECTPGNKTIAPEPNPLPDGNMAANHPDQFSWELFARLFQPVGGNLENGTTRYVL